MAKNDLVVYSAIFGGKDKYKEPPAGNYEVVLLTDEKVKASSHVRVVQIPLLGDPRRMSRRYKMLSHVYFPCAEYTLWMDGSIEALGIDIRAEVIKYLANADLAAFKHTLRKCTYEEAEACIGFKLEDEDRIQKQMARYRNEGLPADLGLVESGVLFRRNTEGIKRFNEIWHEELKNESNRDQLSFYYSMRKSGVKFTQIGESIRRGVGEGGFYVRGHEITEPPVERKATPPVLATPVAVKAPETPKTLTESITESLEPDVWNNRWSQVRKFGGGMAVEYEVGLLLGAIVRCTKPAVVIETGTHRGLATALIAQALKDNGSGHVHTIDIVDYGVTVDLKGFGLDKWFTFYRGASWDVIRELTKTIKKVDFLFLDADHKTENVLREMEAAAPMIQSGTYIAFHDTTIDPQENAAVQWVLKRYPEWEHVRFMSARGFDIMRVP